MKLLSTLYVLAAMALLWLVFGRGPVGLCCALAAGAGLCSCFYGIAKNVEVLKRQDEAMRILRRHEEERRRRHERLRPEGVDASGFLFRTPDNRLRQGLEDPRD